MTMVRFGMWQAILEEPAPPAESHYWQGVWLYARGLAELHEVDAKTATKTLQDLTALAGDPNLPEVFVGFSHAGRLLTIAREILTGEIALKEQRFDEAIAHLDRAVRFEDGLMYNEPPDWFFPSRHLLGAALLDAGRYVEAEQVYWDSLNRYPENGYALLGLSQSFEAQGRQDDADALYKRYEKAWEAADQPLSTSRY
jgi:tetratricopeptide (TPR) repeat protein